MVNGLKATVKEWGHLAVAISAMTAVASGVLAAVFTILFNAFGPQVINTLGIATAKEVDHVRDQLDDVLRRMVVLARPEQVVHYRDAPFALGGECSRGQECTIVLFAARDPRSVECRLIPTETRLQLTQNARTWSVPPVLGRPPTNLSTSPQTVEPRFILPRSIRPGNVSATVVTAYEGCMWQDDGVPPVTQASPKFDINIIPRNEQ